MSEKAKLQELKHLASSITLLYVEDNESLRQRATVLFEKFFGKVVAAENGEEGLKLFKELRPRLVVTDIKMPKMNGLDMARQIHKIAPQTKIMITSAFDDTEFLLEAINVGVYRYLKKPINIDEISTVLLDGLQQLQAEEEDKLFEFYVHNIFNYQQNLLVLFRDQKAVIANKAFLDFFEVDNLEGFYDKYESFSKHFLEHKSFLFSTEEQDWFHQALQNLNKLMHVKMLDAHGSLHHFIFKMTAIKDKEEYQLISMDDITELGLLKLFDENRSNADKTESDKNLIKKLLETAKRNNGEIKMQNFYKGLRITNKGLIGTIDEELIELQSTYIQQKAAQHEGQIILSSELFPADILCERINKISFENQTIEVDGLKFMTDSPSQRVSARLEPEAGHMVSFFYQEHKFGSGVRVLDLSLEAVRISMISLPAGFEEEEPVNVDMVFTVMKKPLIINTKGIVYAIHHEKKEFQVIIKLDPTKMTKKALIDYLAKRQMSLIREFKGSHYEK